jgi:hypothetical protein
VELLLERLLLELLFLALQLAAARLYQWWRARPHPGGPSRTLAVA